MALHTQENAMHTPDEQDSNLVDHVRRDKEKNDSGEKGWVR